MESLSARITFAESSKLKWIKMNLLSNFTDCTAESIKIWRNSNVALYSVFA